MTKIQQVINLLKTRKPVSLSEVCYLGIGCGGSVMASIRKKVKKHGYDIFNMLIRDKEKQCNHSRYILAKENTQNLFSGFILK